MENSGQRPLTPAVSPTNARSSIRAKQLFHEMKQKFPTVSDDLVNDCVMRHSDRATCISLLQRHVDSTAQTLMPPRPPRAPSSPTIRVTERSFAETPENVPPAASSPADTLTVVSRQNSRFSTELTIPPREPREVWDVVEDQPKTPRRYTSVKFNLKDFHRDPETSGREDGSVELMQATNFTYCSSSLDNDRGYQSRLHINVGRNGGVISAVRMRPNANSIPLDPSDSPPLVSVYQPAHSPIPEDKSVNNQLRIKNSLQNEFVNDQKRLVEMQRSLEILKEPFSPERSLIVLQEITELRHNCERMARAVEKFGPYVLGETNEAFYDNIYTGQKLPAQVRRSRSTRISQTTSTSQSIINHHLEVLSGRRNGLTMSSSTSSTSSAAVASSSSSTEASWTCTMCTFGNHPLLTNCEQCEMPRFSAPASQSSTQIFRMAGFNQQTTSSSFHESMNGSLL
ncbi:hypothetical protein DMENIID0001_054950 [Sergentomyia squamirostris]